jgi:hypothetical protein
MELVNNGWDIKYGDRLISLPNRALTPTENNYRVGLKHGFGPYEFPHEMYEVVEDDMISLTDNRIRLTNAIDYQLSGHSSQVKSHVLQRVLPKSKIWTEFNDGFVNTYVTAQISSQLDVVSIPERSPESSADSLEKDIARHIEKIKEAGKMPRVSLDMDTEDDPFIEKAEAALSQGVKSINVRLRGMREHYAKFVFLMELGKKGIWTSASGAERKFRGKMDGEPLPVSMPSLLSAFNIKTTSIRKYNPPLDGNGHTKLMEYNDLSLFDEASLGVLGREEQRLLYPSDEFVSDCGFAPFEDMRSRRDIYTFCTERDLHQPIYSYETVASRYALLQSSRHLRNGTFEAKYAPEHTYLDRTLEHVQSFQ